MVLRRVGRKTLCILHPKWRDFTERVIWAVVLVWVVLRDLPQSSCRLRKALRLVCVWRDAAHLGRLELFSAGCHGNISARTQSNAWMCVRDRREPRNIPHTLLSSVLVVMQQQISVHHALHPVSLASSLLLIFLFLHHTDFSPVAFEMFPLTASVLISHDWGLDLNIILLYAVHMVNLSSFASLCVSVRCPGLIWCAWPCVVEVTLRL